jgi:hypothetical protein
VVLLPTLSVVCKHLKLSSELTCSSDAWPAYDVTGRRPMAPAAEKAGAGKAMAVKLFRFVPENRRPPAVQIARVAAGSAGISTRSASGSVASLVPERARLLANMPHGNRGARLRKQAQFAEHARRALLLEEERRYDEALATMRRWPSSRTTPRHFIIAAIFCESFDATMRRCAAMTGWRP